MRIGVFGGTFDPPHLGHLVVASEVRHAGGFDVVLLMVANDPWQKRGARAVTAAERRLDLVRAAVAGHDFLVVSDLEVRRGGSTYTVDTVEQLLADEPGATIDLVLGADAVAGLNSWHRAEELADLVGIAMVNRPGGAPEHPSGPWRIRRIDVPQIAISSTEIRSRVADGRPIDFLVPDGVRSIIEQHGLYGERR